ncbi:trehalose-6-phosphate phosphatase [Sistotremastrum niveocremeum HHB9708]|uniref:Trehalose-6-phosphate phosphatase n=1 Tax=Sistotremastrum niveocremeum HHB9708 TaxID=1314777 RepID=A0A164XQX2_9AGAM|nr:trehalose-6-phosphate phosphatase [Sistotremastrum niveocremeum HHB9708]
MDSFAEPVLDSAKPSQLSLPEVRDAIKALQQQHLEHGIKLSGRIIHVCHYLPVELSKLGGSSSAPLTPPKTPDYRDGKLDVQPPSLDQLNLTDVKKPAKWQVAPRHGHSATISGIRSLSETHEQLIVGWVGDIEVARNSAGVSETIPANSLTEEDKKEVEELLDENEEALESEEPGKKAKLVPVWLDDKIAHAHYEGYCKTILWPLFHYLLWQDVATETSTVDDNWDAYVQANQAFTDAVLRVAQPGDLIWIHDYHLLLVPGMLRKANSDSIVGLFIHTPFPSSEVFRCLPKRKEVLDGMLGANLVCFQTYAYSRHFASTCTRVCGYEIVSRGVDVQGHVAAIGHCAVGIDADRVAKDATRPGVKPKAEALRALYEGKKIIVGRDKLDVVKGVLQKLKAFEKLLRDYPEWRGNVVLIQVTAPAQADSSKLEHQVSELVASINGEFGSLDFIPIHHYHQTIKRDEFYALLSVADLAVITPLRDGMNTASMEFVIAQEHANKSPLILSEFMGISNNMSHALQINPWNLGDVAAAINYGLLMSEEEKAQRHAALYGVVTTHTSHTWAAVLVKMLLSQLDNDLTAHQTPLLNKPQLIQSYEKAKKRLFLFDYDGTLTPIVKTPSMAVPSPEALEALTKLSEDPRNVVYIISGRDGDFLEHHFGHLKKIGMSAEHGSFVRSPGADGWSNLTEELDMSWMDEVLEIFKYYTERTTGSHIETKKCSITWHYRASDPEWGLFQCRQCQDLLENNLTHKRPIEVLVGKKNLEVRPIAVNKGEIVKRILYNNPDAEMVFCAGDDKTDEDMFRSLRQSMSSNGPAVMQPPAGVIALNGVEPKPVQLAIRPESIFSTAVGASSKKTLASWHVTTPQEVIEHMLELVNKPSSDAPANI